MRNSIALNFLPLATEQFHITLYCIPFADGKRPEYKNETAVSRNLEVNGNYSKYWTLFQKPPDGTKQVFQPLDNTYLTIDALRLALVRSCREKLSNDSFRVNTKFRRYIEIITDEYPEGSRAILLEPYFLRSRGQYGFLVNLHFRPKEEYRGTRRVLKLSLALDKHGQPNRNYYADRYTQLIAFVKDFHNKIFPLSIPGGSEVKVSSHFVELDAKSLEMKTYVVGSRNKSPSQFRGIQESGPLKHVPNDVHLYFLYRRQDHALAQDLFRALRGDTFPTFPGMHEMFNLAISRDNVSGAVISNFTSHEILRVRDRVNSDTAGRDVVPIILTPFGKHDRPDDNAAYWDLKHAFLEKGLPIQVVHTKTVADKNKLKWSAASIGLQIFAKLGGIPWKVKPRLEKCLIVGIGQSHQRDGAKMGRFFAYAVLTDSSGIFEEVQVLGNNISEQDYISNFGNNLRRIFEKYSDKYSSFVVHSTFKVQRRELEAIAEVLTEKKNQLQSGEFVSLKFNDRNRFFGFSVDHNSRVPYESSTISLSESEYLVWFEGLQYRGTLPRKVIGNPLHVEFTYPHKRLSKEQHKVFLQDAINLSGANWRGFNAKSLPVSVYYAQLIARYLKEFDRRQLRPVDVTAIKPWFL